jgi:hypothetical protein
MVVINKKKVAMTTAERQRKYMSNPLNREKHRERMRAYNEKMKRARLLAKQNGIW